MLTNEYSKHIQSECSSCGKCRMDCVMLSEYNIDPRVHFSQFAETGMLGNSSAVIPYSCMMCGLCSKNCPKSLKLNDGFMEMRKNLILQNKEKLPLKQLKSIQMHQKLSFSKIFSGIGRGTTK